MDSGATATATVFGNLINATGGTSWTDEEIAAVNDVLDAAQSWADGYLPLAAFERIGTLKPPVWTSKHPNTGVVTTCRGNDLTGYSRWKALVYALKTHDDRVPALQSALAELGAIREFVAPAGAAMGAA